MTNRLFNWIEDILYRYGFFNWRYYYDPLRLVFAQHVKNIKLAQKNVARMRASTDEWQRLTVELMVSVKDDNGNLLSNSDPIKHVEILASL